MLSLRKKRTSLILELYTNIERGYGSLAVIKELLFYIFKILFLVIYYNFSIYIYFLLIVTFLIVHVVLVCLCKIFTIHICLLSMRGY